MLDPSSRQQTAQQLLGAGPWHWRYGAYLAALVAEIGVAGQPVSEGVTDFQFLQPASTSYTAGLAVIAETFTFTNTAHDACVHHPWLQQNSQQRLSWGSQAACAEGPHL